MIIRLSPLFDHKLGFFAIRKKPAIQTFSPKGAVEALTQAESPGDLKTLLVLWFLL
jgi:hypothetical protein